MGQWFSALTETQKEGPAFGDVLSVWQQRHSWLIKWGV